MEEKLVTIATYRFANEAELAKMHLEDAGITAFLADVEVVNMDWLLGNAIGNIKLQVAQAQAEPAAALLAGLTKPRSADPPDEDAEQTEDVLCLACGEEMPEIRIEMPFVRLVLRRGGGRLSKPLLAGTVASRQRGSRQVPKLGDVQESHLRDLVELGRVSRAGCPDDHGTQTDHDKIRVVHVIGLTRTGNDPDRHERTAPQPRLDVVGGKHQKSSE